jgi:hypothetical protein
MEHDIFFDFSEKRSSFDDTFSNSDTSDSSNSDGMQWNSTFEKKSSSKSSSETSSTESDFG